MSIDQSLIKHLSNLAKLDPAIDNSENLRSSLNSILSMVEQIQAVDTSTVQTLANPLDNTQILRQDFVTETDQREQLLELAPQSEQGLFLVPKVIE